ncbi:MAG: MFS transporter [Haloferacaceae archaeon]
MSWRGVGLVSSWQMTASVCFYAIFAATAFVRDGFGVSRTLVGITVTAVMLGYTGFLLLTGAAVDGYGERPVMVAGLLVLASGMLGVVFAGSYAVLLVALLVVGAGYASAMPSTNRAVLEVAPRGRRNLAMNVKQVGVTAGSGLSAVLVTGLAATRLGWRAGFVVAGALGLAVAVAFARGYRGTAGSGSLSPPDVRGLLHRRGYRTLLTAGVFLGAAAFSTTGYVVLYVTESVGLAAGFAGLSLALVQVGGSTSRIVGGTVADRLPLSDVRANGAVMTGQLLVAVAAYVAILAVHTRVETAVAFALLGFFVLGFPGIYYACLTALVPDDSVGAASAGGQMAINVGGLLAPPAFGFVVDSLSYDVAWLGVAACAALAALLVAPLALGEVASPAG